LICTKVGRTGRNAKLCQALAKKLVFGFGGEWADASREARGPNWYKPVQEQRRSSVEFPS
jgi:hypothetical protein